MASLGEVLAGGLFSDGDWVESKDQDPNGEVRLIQLADIGEGTFRDRSNRHLRPDVAERLRCTYLKPGDVLVARMPDPLGRACLMPALATPAVTAVDVCILRSGADSVNPSWLMWTLNSPQVRRKVAALQSGTTRKRISRKNLATIRVPVPPLSEQERIVAAIEEHLSRLDAASAANESARSRFGRFSECLLAEIFDSNWPRVPLNSLNEPERPIGYGILKPKTDRPGVVPYVEVRSIVGGEIQVDQLHKTTRELHEAFPRSILRTGDVVIAVRGSFDRAAVVPPALDGANISRDVARIAPTDALLPRFLAAFLMSPEARRYFAAHARGVAVRGINIGDLRQLPVPAPPLETQRSALAKIGAGQDGLRRLETETHAVAVRGRRLRQAVLAAAFSGQLTGAAA